MRVRVHISKQDSWLLINLQKIYFAIGRAQPIQIK